MKKEKIVIFDTNMLLQESFTLLKSKEAEEYLRILAHAGYKIAIPSIIKKELIINSIENYNERFIKLSEQIEKIAPFHGKDIIFEEKLKSKKLIKIFKNRFNELKDILFILPNTKLQHKKAFRRILQNKPPNTKKSSQPKDSLILETLLELAVSYEVLFVTKDKAFFDQRNPSKGVEPIISEEIFKNNLKLNILFGDLFNNYLSKYEKDIPPIPIDEISSELNLLIQRELLNILKNKGINEVKKEEIVLNSFHTKNKNILLITFTGKIRIFHEEDSSEVRNSNSGIITVHGSVNYSFEDKKLLSFKVHSRNLNWPRHTNRSSYYATKISINID